MGIFIAADVTIALGKAGGMRLIHSYNIYIGRGDITSVIFFFLFSIFLFLVVFLCSLLDSPFL